MKLIGVKYCGGCNPQIDRAKVIRELVKKLPDEYQLTSSPSDTGWFAAVMVCGCEVACAYTSENRRLARRWILVSGTSVDLTKTPESEIDKVVADKLLQVRNGVELKR